jgi:hypothetical protein
VKRIAILLFALSLVASAARADGIKAAASTLGVGAISTILCTLTVVYGSDDAESSSEGFDRRGFFIGAGGGFAGENFSDRPMNDIADIFSNQPQLDVPIMVGPETTATADDSWSVVGRGGYRCHPRYSVGASFEYFGGFDTQWTGVLGTGGDDIDIFAATVDIKGYLLTGRYQPYLLVGGGTMHIDTSVTNPTGITDTIDNDAPPPDNLPVFGPKIQSRDFTDFVFRLGGGFDLYATDHVVVNIGATYMLPLGEVSGVDLFTVGGGIEYRF